MEELVTGAVEETAPAAQKWYEGVSLEDAEIYIQANRKSAARSVIAIGYYLNACTGMNCLRRLGTRIYANMRKTGSVSVLRPHPGT